MIEPLMAPPFSPPPPAPPARHRLAHPAHGDDLRSQVLYGLRQQPKRIACKFLYDHRGSALFERICQLPEYYPTRTELGILARNAPAIADLIGPDCLLVEYGSGSSTKTRLLLDCLERPAAYVPVDISRECLLSTAGQLAADYPHLPIVPVCADYTRRFALPAVPRTGRRMVAFFPGSTIGNFSPPEAVGFLTQVRALTGPEGGLVIGVDMKKDPRILHAAYNDAAGVTAAFNLNLLVRFNRELAGDFVLEQFAHYACYNALVGRIEMHLVSLREQAVTVGRERMMLGGGETIFTESSYKYSLDQFARLAQAAGYRVVHVWRDPRELFSVQYLVPAAGAV
jgi:dimethylhistidine N-methyltransferase